MLITDLKNTTNDQRQNNKNIIASVDSSQIERIKKLLKEKNAVLITHYYTEPILQYIAENTGGIVADSLEMARVGKNHPASTIIVGGVKFMGETAKILSPEKKVIMPDINATCSLDIGCPADEFELFCKKHPDRTVVVYANTSAKVKALADWTVTSSCAVNIVEHLNENNHSLIWAPDRYLGQYIKKQTDVDMLIWNGSCIVHEEFKAQGILNLKNIYKDAAVLVHPESPASVIDLADFVGSTSQLIEAAAKMKNNTFIVATEKNIFYKMQEKLNDQKRLIAAPTGGNGATCKSCAKCPWMAMNTIDSLEQALTENNCENEIFVEELVRQKALISLEKMLNFTSLRKQ